MILITLDAFRYDLALRILDRLNSLRRLRKEGVSFVNAFSTGPYTFTSFPGIISSIYPYYFGFGIPREVETLASILKGEGYNTAIINESNALLSPYYGYEKGMDFQEHFIELSHRSDRRLKNVFLENRRTKRNEDREGGESIISVLARKFAPKAPRVGKRVYQIWKFLSLYLTDPTNRLQERMRLHESFRNTIQNFIRDDFREPQFLWIHTILNHLPYTPASTVPFSERDVDILNYKGISGFVTPQTAEQLRRLYVESLVTTDLLIGTITECLASRNLLNDSIVVVTADHGEEFLEDGRFFGHSPHSSSDRLLRVPLIFYSPAINSRNREIPHPVSTLDILPTLLDILDLEVPATARGLSLKPLVLGKDEKSIVSTLATRPLFSEAWEVNDLLDRSPGYASSRKIFSVRKSNHKLTVRVENNGNLTKEEYELTNWPTGEKLDAKKHVGLMAELDFLLRKHLHESYRFYVDLKTLDEKTRIKKTLRRMSLRT